MTALISADNGSFNIRPLRACFAAFATLLLATSTSTAQENDLPEAQPNDPIEFELDIDCVGSPVIVIDCATESRNLLLFDAANTQDATEQQNSITRQTRLDNEGGLLGPFLNRLGFSRSEIYNHVLPTLRPHLNPNRMSGRQKIIMHETPEGELLALEFPSLDNPIESYVYSLDTQDVEIKELPFTYATEYIDAEIQYSFYRAMDRAGANDSLIREMIRLYSWDVNWQRDIRRGDEAAVLFNIPETANGQRVPSRPEIAYARLSVGGEPTEIFRFENSDGEVDYYKPDGTSIRRSLLRTPIDGARLSSSFNPRRLHPVYRTYRPHNGTDFAAPIGTPIYAAGDGTITFRGREPGDGNLIRIEHGNNLVTGYSHMNGFAPGLISGDRVNQGQVIGYVGMTGTATGPHLHYSIKENGRFVNPETFDLPEGKHLEGQDLERFNAERDDILEQVTQYAAPSPTQ